MALLILTGGLVYLLGALAHGTRRLHLNSRLFRFHGVFYAYTIAAAVCHGVAIRLAVFQTGMECGSYADNAAHRAWEDDVIWQLIGGILGTEE